MASCAFHQATRMAVPAGRESYTEYPFRVRAIALAAERRTKIVERLPKVNPLVKLLEWLTGLPICPILRFALYGVGRSQTAARCN